MNTDRLLMLAARLDEVNPSNFRMDSWMQGGPDPNQCGTTACALGWAAMIPEFQALGIHVWEALPEIFAIRWDDGGRTLLGQEVARSFFDLDAWTTHEIFYGPSMLPQEKALQIRRLVAEHLSEKALRDSLAKALVASIDSDFLEGAKPEIRETVAA